MPERGAFTGVASRQQQCPRGTFAEARGEQGRAADLGGDQRLDLVGLEDEDVGARGGVVGVGQPHDDAVVGGGGLFVDAVAVIQPLADRQRQRPVHPQAVRGVQDDPPVAEFVAEPFDHQRGVRRHRRGGLALLIDQLPQIVDRKVVETDLPAAGFELLPIQPRQLPGERADRRAELRRPADPVAAPERQPRRLPRRRNHQHPVVSDFGDAPTGRAQRDHVTGAGLVDHLLVEFADPRRLLGVRRGGQVDGEQPAVGDRTAGGDGQPLGAGPGGQGPGVAVIDDARTQLGEVGGRVLSGQQIQCGLECAARQRRERGAAPHGVEPAVGVDRLQRAGGDGVLGEHVERVGRHLHRLDLPGQHALHGDRAADQVGAVFRQQHALADLADLVAGPADALQPAGNRRRGLDLDDQIDRAHVDAELETRCRDDGLESPALERFLDLGAGFLADRTVVRPGQHRLGAVGLSAAHQVCRRPAGHPRVVGAELDAGAFGVDLVEPGGQPFGQPPRVGEHDRAAVRLDQVDDALLDIGPDRVVLEVGHVGHRHLYGQVEGLGGRRGDNRGRGRAGQETGHLLGRAHCRREPDPLRRPLQHRVEAFQRQRQMRAAFGARHGVHLVDDDGLHAGQGVAGR